MEAPFLVSSDSDFTSALSKPAKPNQVKAAPTPPYQAGSALFLSVRSLPSTCSVALILSEL